MSAAWTPDEDVPFDSDEHAQQLRGVRAWLGSDPRRVLDVGCGRGRILRPLVEAGHRLVGIDVDGAALAECRSALAAGDAGLDADVELIEADFRAPWTVPPASFDAVVCLGNTFMLLDDVDDAVRFLTRAAEAVRPGGAVLLDDGPRDFWPELTEGNWTSGISPDGAAQLVWHPTDAVFVLRTGDAVDAATWELTDDDRRFRMWTDGALALAAHHAGLSAPCRPPDAPLLILERPS